MPLQELFYIGLECCVRFCCMRFATSFDRNKKAGYTLVEVLVVVIILGILSSMGFAGLQQAIANSRVKDAAVNTAAFVERVANLSTQRDEVLCLKIDPSNPHKILALRDTEHHDCTEPRGSVDSMTIDAPTKFVSRSAGCPAMHDWFGAGEDKKYRTFKPRPGLSAVPPEGGVCIKYGDSDVYGAVRKTKELNRVVPMWKVGNDATQNGNWSNWSEL